MTFNPYPYTATSEDIIPNLREIQRLREQEDIPDFINLNQRFVAGRNSTRVPSSATNVLSTDNLGDIVNDATFEYKLIDIGGGTLRWDRRTLDVAW